MDESPPTRLVQTRLLAMAAIFVVLYALTYALAPFARYHSLQAPLNWVHWFGVLAWLAGFYLVHLQMAKTHPFADPYILPITALLTGWGLITIFRLNPNFGLRQTLWLAIALFGLRTALRSKNTLDWLRRYKYIWVVAGLLITAATFLFGTFPSGEGPRLWFGFGRVYFQPSEILKLLLIIYLAGYLAGRLPNSLNLIGLLAPSLILLAFALAILVAQRDMGTAILFISIYSITFYLASGRRRILLLTMAGIAVAVFAGYRLFPVIQQRLDSWFSPWADPGGRSFQVIQSLMAFAAGSVFGRGPGLGSPGVVPIAHSDFIFAAIGEETGIVGITGLLLLYALLISRGIQISIDSSSRYNRYLAAGISAYFAAQAILVAGGNILFLPLTGATLPLVSYGGSSLITAFLAILLLIVTSPQQEEEPAWIARPDSYKVVMLASFAALAVIAGLAGWWGLVRSDRLLTRGDNPRRYINDRFVRRGEILDRNNLVLVASEGASGAIQRRYYFPRFSLISGYNSPLIGQSGVEAGLDGYLSGKQGIPSLTIWWHSLLYGQNPPGLPVRLTIDRNYQALSDDFLNGHSGAAVMLNADSGEILSMSSSPGFDANQVSVFSSPQEFNTIWAPLTESSSSPLLNRATQGQYTVANTLGIFMLVDAAERMTLPDPQVYLANQNKPVNLEECVQPHWMDGSLSWNTLIRAGCPAAAQELSALFTPTQSEQLANRLGFTAQSSLEINTAPPLFADGDAELPIQNWLISPLNMALAGSVLANDGKVPSPVLALAVKTPQEGWLVLSNPSSRQPYNPNIAAGIAESLSTPGSFYWETVSRENDGEKVLTWYLGGTLPSWQGIPLSVAVVLEEDNPNLARTIGESLLKAAIQ